jgi:membrane fusion protein, copper/silver efflux system
MATDDTPHMPDAHEPMPEGEEAPPKGVKTMARIRWGILIGLSVFALVMIIGYFGLFAGGGEKAAAVKYYCPMHPTYVSDKPGECPICGMDLVLMPDSGKAPEAEKPTAAAPSGEMAGMPGMETPSSPKPSGATAGMEGFEVPGTSEVTIEPQRLQMIGIKTAKVERRLLGEKITLAGYVAADETRTRKVTIRAGGWVKELFVDKTGQYVDAGQPLLSIYSQELYQAGQDLLVAMKSADQKATDTSLTTMRQQLLEAARQRLQLLGLSDKDIAAIEQTGTAPATITLHSPVAGYVLEKSVSPGQYVGMEQTLYTVADLSTIWVLAEVYEQNLSDIKVGQTAMLHMTAYPEEPFEGKVSFIYPSISEATRTLKVRLEFANHGMHLRPGMYGEVAVERGGAETLAIPADAVMDDGSVKYVFVVSDGKHFTG